MRDRMFNKVFISVFFFLLLSCNNDTISLTSINKTFQLEFYSDGSVKSIFDKANDKDYLEVNERSYLMSIRINGVFEHPVFMNKKDDIIQLKYPSQTMAEIRYISKESYFTFELVKLKGNQDVELITWGPYFSTINKTIGETIGVVRNDEFALGIQSLNIKTLGGYPYKEDDSMPEFDVFLQDDITDLSEENKPQVLYRIEAAKPTKSGSSLQTYSRNRNKDRIIENLDHTKFRAPAIDDGGIIGSKIALFGCPVENALNTIGEIEIEEGLPHPLIDGEWMKASQKASSAYLIMDFNESNIGYALDITKRAGLKHLYHYGKTFESWGHFELSREAFPNGYDGMKKCVELAKRDSISVGTHTLSNFITTNDLYVTPIPDKRLAEVGNSILTNDIDENQIEIEIASPDFFNQFKNNNLRTVRIGNELIRYGNVTEKKPWKLLDCQRGAFKTEILKHKAGDTIGKLIDHAYQVFLSNADLTIELSENIANLYNKTGMKQISFDGLEGNKSTGLGNYGETLMPYVWYNNLSEDLKNGLIIDASRTTHFFWHIYTRMNWGEPWYADFRESQTKYRMKNQAYFQRNFMPRMLGWFNMTSEISLEDMEWMLARSAAFDAGYALVTNIETLKKHGQSNEILELIKQWERARLSGVFPLDLKKEMESLENEYHLEALGKDNWSLVPLTIKTFHHSSKIRQPGEPLHSIFNFENTFRKEPLVLTIKLIEATTCSNISVELDNYKKVLFPVTLSNNQIIRYEGGNHATIYDKNWNFIKTVDLSIEKIDIDKGSHTITVDCDFLSIKKSEIKIEVKTFGEPINLKT